MCQLVKGNQSGKDLLKVVEIDTVVMWGHRRSALLLHVVVNRELSVMMESDVALFIVHCSDFMKEKIFGFPEFSYEH